MNNTITLCPACERLMCEAYDLKKVSAGQYRRKEKAASCGYCGKRVVVLGIFEATPKRRRADAGA